MVHYFYFFFFSNFYFNFLYVHTCFVCSLVLVGKIFSILFFSHLKFSTLYKGNRSSFRYLYVRCSLITFIVKHSHDTALPGFLCPYIQNCTDLHVFKVSLSVCLLFRFNNYHFFLRFFESTIKG